MKTSTRPFTAAGSSRKEARENLKNLTWPFTKNKAWRFSKRPSFKKKNGGWEVSATVEFLTETVELING